MGSHVLPYLMGTSSGLEDALAACGVTICLDAAGAMQVLHRCAEQGSSSLSLELATFLYRVIAEEVAHAMREGGDSAMEENLAQTLSTFASESMILVQQQKSIDGRKMVNMK